ncbi:MAG: ATP synthase F1 subunit delta [Candidatus Magasanikbacteria bacterium CG10_big_fil_rev_8_21_14_0_10_42_10]|uniref:ATP synthase subunit delta n=2 Tax=Candidatus Magasanikiibacteriota TaxID=1752731 RepID=A0A2H0TUX6_9BACT|nr:MAG: ATP synthase F1 subunit delta [Candidatus Magasanikbacteria bacterium CG10_big_fil_rev_8_21_14_0_10_42_10]PIZ92479.1 MAG: ATP synthase F1 subunit delta [Candidatus Magasanikbacteria bacterium CG_4_10_14_0_2_um_filter_41_10]
MATLLPKQYAKILYELTNGKSGSDLEKTVEAFVTFLVQERVITKKEYILTAFKEYAKTQEGIQKILITSARTMSDSLIEKIAHIFGKKVEVDTAIDASLIGGIVVRSGDTILDASVKTQLEQLQRQLS